MKQLALPAAILLTFIAAPSFAIEMVTTTSSSNAIECQHLNKADIDSDTPINCYNNVEITGRASTDFPDNQQLTADGKPTVVIFQNKGAYLAKLNVSYSTIRSGYRQDYYMSTPYIAVGANVSIEVPGDAGKLTVAPDLITGLLWNPSYVIFSQNMCKYNNNYQDIYNNNNRKMQFDVWGTTFYAPWALVQPGGTYISSQGSGTCF